MWFLPAPQGRDRAQEAFAGGWPDLLSPRHHPEIAAGVSRDTAPGSQFKFQLPFLAASPTSLATLSTGYTLRPVSHVGGDTTPAQG